MERDKSGSSRGLSIVLEGRTASVSASKGPIIQICELDSVSKWLSHIQLWQMKDMTYIIAIMAGLFLYHCCPCSPQFKHFHSIVSACSSLFFPASLLFLLFGVLWLFCRWSTALPPRQIESPKFFKGWWNWGDSSCSTFWHRLVTLSTFFGCWACWQNWCTTFCNVTSWSKDCSPCSSVTHCSYDRAGLCLSPVVLLIPRNLGWETVEESCHVVEGWVTY
jgi:hypothetical protein